MENKTIGNWLIAIIVLAFIGGIGEFSDDYFTVIGLGIMFFGIWGGIRLRKS